MPNYGGKDPSQQAAYDGNSTHEITLQDFFEFYSDTTRENARAMRRMEEWIVGPGGDAMDLAGALGSLAVSVKNGGPVAALPGVATTIAKMIYSNHLPSKAAEWLANLTDVYPDAAPQPGMGLVPEQSKAIALQNDDLGTVKTIVTAQGTTDLSDIMNLLYTLPDDVWNVEKWVYPLGTGQQSMQLWEVLMYAYDSTRYALGTEGLHLPKSPDFDLLIGDPAWLPDAYAHWNTGTHIAVPPPLDFAAIETAGSILAWLEANAPTFAWSYEGPDGMNVSGDNTVWAPALGMTGAWWKCKYSDRILAQQEAPQSIVGSLWPGVANVTLGTPVPFTGKVLLEAVMDGCLIQITEVPPGQSQYPEAGTTRYKGLGWMSFHSDNGDLEPHQAIEWPNSVFVPHNMQQAVSADIWTKPTTSGIVTPWTRNL